jgi:hypothetical protein
VQNGVLWIDSNTNTVDGVLNWNSEKLDNHIYDALKDARTDARNLYFKSGKSGLSRYRVTTPEHVQEYINNKFEENMQKKLKTKLLIDDPENYRVFRTKNPRDARGGNEELHQAVISSGGYYSDAQEGYVFPKGSEDKIKEVAYKLGDDTTRNWIQDARGKPVTGREAVGKRFGNMRDVVGTAPGRGESKYHSQKPSTTTRIDKDTGSHWYGSKFEVRPHEEGADLYYQGNLVAQGRQPHSNPKTRQSKNIKRLLAEAKYLEEEPDEIQNQIKNPRMIQKSDSIQFILNQIKKAISV